MVLLRCEKCQTPLPGAVANTRTFVACPACGVSTLLEVFPALARPAERGRFSETLAAEEDAGCFYHPGKKAVVPCEDCGRFLCALCDLEIDGHHVCPSCLNLKKHFGKGPRAGEALRTHARELLRFNPADIQAVQVRLTVRGMIYSVILVVLLAILLLITIFAGDSLRVRLICGGACAVPLLILLLFNVCRGATCRTLLVTALGPQTLPSLTRTRSTLRAIAAIRTAVEGVQGALPPPDASRMVDDVRQRHPFGRTPGERRG